MQIDASTPTLNEFIDQTSSALGAIDARSAQLTDLVSQSRVTADALSSEDQALTQALTNLPGALTEGSATFERLRKSTLPALEQLVNATRPVTGPLRPFLSQLQPVLNEAVPTVSLLRQILDKPGPNNDLLDALRDLPALGKAVSSDFPRAIKALQQSTPIFESSSGPTSPIWSPGSRAGTACSRPTTPTGTMPGPSRCSTRSASRTTPRAER